MLGIANNIMAFTSDSKQAFVFVFDFSLCFGATITEIAVYQGIIIEYPDNRLAYVYWLRHYQWSLHDLDAH